MATTTPAPADAPATEQPADRTAPPRAPRLALVAGPGVLLLAILALPGLRGRDLWLDEAYSMAATRSPWTSIRGEHGTMALYYALLGPWSAVSSSGWWVRSLSLVLMAAAVVVLTSLVRRHRGDGTARWAALFASSSYLVVHLAGEARSYGLVSLLVVGGWWALDRAVDEPDRRRWWALYWTCCALVPLAHGVAVLQVGAQLFAVVVARLDRPTTLRAAAGLGGSLAVFAGLWAVGLGAEGSWVTPLDLHSATVLLESLSHPEPVLAVLVGAVIVVCAVRLGREGLAATDPTDRFRSLLWISWGLATVVALLALSAVRPLQIPRYTVGSAFGIAGLLAVGLHRPGSSERLPVVPILVLLVIALGGLLGGSDDPPSWSTAARQVQAEVRAGDGFAFPNPDSRLTFEAAWHEEGGRPDLRGLDVVGVGPSLGSLARYGDDLTTAELAAAAATDPTDRLWVASAPQAGADDALTAFLDDPGVRRTYVATERWDLDQDITLVLLERR